MQRTVSVINLTAIRRNALLLRERLGDKKFYAVVKADAYGHGAERVAAEISDIADGFCVAIAEEGAALRIAGITKPVLVFTPPLDADDAARMEYYSLTPTVNDRRAARLIGGLACHIKVNTGMNRYGCTTESLQGVLDELEPGQIEGVYSHLYAADDEEASLSQLRLFDKAESAVKKYSANAVAHIAASGGLLRGGVFIKDGARCGIALYGYAPRGFVRGELTPALKVSARKVQTGKFIGGGAGYAAATRRYDELSSYRCGYADGFARGVPLGENALCMDAFVSTDMRDTVCVMDDADEYAARCGTISYEALCNVTRRSVRIYEK